MRVLARVDASPRIGFGHLARTSTLVGALEARGAQLTFASHAPADAVRAWVEGLGTALAPLDGAADFLEKYRSKHEVAEARKRGPIGLYEAQLLKTKKADEETLARTRVEEKAIVDEAVTFAEESPEPELSELYTDVYADS